MKTHWIAGAAIALAGCVGSASFVLKTPLSNQCAKARLQGCDEISEGVLLYADGKKSEATAKLRSGAAQNSPEKIKQFAAQLETLTNLPGAEKYAGAINEVVATLTLSGSGFPSEGQGGFSDGDGAQQPTSAALASSDRHGVVTADTDMRQNRSGVAKVPADSPDWCDKFGKGTQCLLLLKGPLFLTEAIASAVDCKGQFLAIVSGGQVSVEFPSPLSLNGARILVPPRASLVVGQRPETQGEKPAIEERGADTATDKPPVDSEPAEVSPQRSCSLYWSGFVPYGAAPATGSQPFPEGEPALEGRGNSEEAESQLSPSSPAPPPKDPGRARR